MKAYVFPGQGSQARGMGENLFDEFTDLTHKADEILGYSVKELCLDDPGRQLNQTMYTQPAIYVVNALSYAKKIREGGGLPDYLAGHSLGEYNALQAAGVFSFEVGLELVKKRGELMSKARNGAMAAILNCTEQQIREILDRADLTTIDIANFNAPSQIVISGLEEDIRKSESCFEHEGAMFIQLNTSGAFHSRYMKEVEAEYGSFVKNYTFRKPEIKVISNVTARPYEFGNIGQGLNDQLSHCVRWHDSIGYLLDQGVIEFAEAGPGSVLTKLIGNIRKEWTPGRNVVQAPSEESDPAGSDQSTVEESTGKCRTNASNVLMLKHDKLKSAQASVENWNNSCPVGTRIYSDLYKAELETRTKATLLFGHRAAVYVKGYRGYFDLREVAPVGYIKPIVFMFSGQGSHYYHMGKELYQRAPAFKKWLDEADNVALDVFGKSIVATVFDESKQANDPFAQSMETAAAIIILGYAMANFLMEKGIKPDYLLGSSLGEITSAVVGGGVDLYDALTGLSRHQPLFDQNCEKGKMISVLDGPELYHENRILREFSELAAINSEAHFVVSCQEQHAARIEGQLKEQNVNFQTVSVSNAFHSSLIDPAKMAFKEAYADTPFNLLKVPLVSCAHAAIVDKVDSSHFWDVYRLPIRFHDTIQLLLKQQDYTFLDLGPSGTLCNFVKYNLGKDSKSKHFSILTPFMNDLENLEIVQQYFESTDESGE
jgi:malonyl CoA-acyl carrier protein transacylase